MKMLEASSLAALLLALGAGVGCQEAETVDDDASTSTSASSAATTSAGGGAASSSASSVTSASSSSSGAGGGSACTPITMGALLDTDTEAGGSSLAFAITGLDAAKSHVAYVEFYDVAGTPQAGTYDLSMAPDDNYSTCARCLLVFEDFSDPSPIPFYPVSGTLNVDEADTGFTGESAGTLSNVVFEQVTINGTVTTPVPDGRCLSLPSGSWDTTP